ncbi:MAG: acyl-CoA synthetase [Alphaproteobacteria bacterium]|nr:acyl-CoA synthetase [Alphaproteobacteria bacterium]
MTGLLPPLPTYEECYSKFRWQMPTHFNIAEAVCDRHAAARPDVPAIVYEGLDGRALTMTFGELQAQANRLANVLVHYGVKRGDRVAIHLPQSFEAAFAHVAAYKLGAIALPLFSLFGPDALRHRLADSGARILITCRDNLGVLDAVRDDLGALAHVLVTDGAALRDQGDLPRLMERASATFETVRTRADDPAMLIYTSGTTGDPKGALHAHRVLLGHMPGVEFPHRYLPHDGDLMWTPADWAWAGGLLDVLLPGLFHGVPVLAKRFAKFDPEAVFELMARHKVRNTFMPATALRMLRQYPDPGRFGVSLRSIASGGEALGEDLVGWGRETFGLTINEFYGQTEVNLVVGNNADVMPIKVGSMGRPIPGHEVALIDADGNDVPVGEIGTVAVRRPDPVMFIEYWNKPDATAAKFIGDWCVLGDLAWRDEDGYFWFKSRDDDVIISSSYRIGPTEVEECLVRHPAVAMAGVIGSPDAVRGEVVKAYVVLAAGSAASETVRDDIQAFVKRQLSAHEYPRQIRFIEELPLTVTGKIQRMKLRELDVAERTGGDAGS